MELHPLENPLILSHLFSVSPPSLLKSCRLVCRQWLQISLPIWRSSFPLHFTKNYLDDYVIRNRSDSSGPRVTLAQFLDYVAHPANEYQSKPHRHFHFSGSSFGRSEEDPMVQQFWDAIGPGMTHLELALCSFNDAGAFRKLVFQKFPNLQKLTLANCTLAHNPTIFEGSVGEDISYQKHDKLQTLRIDHTIPGEFPVPFKELLEHCPWITTLAYAGPYFENRQEYYKDLNVLLRAIKLVRECDKRKLPLKHFDWASAMIEICEDKEAKESMTLFRELRIPLKLVKICATPGMDEDAVTNALEFHRDSIRKICITQDWDTVPIPNHFRFTLNMELSNLQDLTMMDEQAENMEFLKFTPNLEKLFIYNVLSTVIPKYIPRETEMISRTPKGDRTNLRLEKLKEFKLEYIVSDDDMKCLVDWMPNVQTLVMILNEKKFQLVCEHLKNLEDLRLMSGSAVVTDEMICGRKFPEKDEIELEDDVRRPNISHLQNLKTIQFGEAKLTDVSVFEGFIHLPKLMQIVTCVEFGEKARNALRDKMVRPFSSS